MSKESDTNKSGSNKNNKQNNLDYKRISMNFLDSIFENIQENLKIDPLNIKTDNESLFLSYAEKKDLETPQKGTTNTKSSKRTYHKNNSTEKIVKNLNKNYKNLNSASSAKNIYSAKNHYKYLKKPNKGLKKTNSINENYKAKQESEKEKKIYQEKVRLLENRLKALKNEEEEINRKKHCNELRQNYINKKKQEKNDFKQQLLSNDIDKRNALDEKRKAIQKQKIHLNNNLKESLEKNKNSKIQNYKKLQNEKKETLNIIHENNYNFEKYGKNNVKKIQKERQEVKMNELRKMKHHGKSMDNYYLKSLETNKHETEKLKDKIKKLEKLEVEYINSLNETRQGITRNNSVGVYYFKREMTPVKKLNLNEQGEGKKTHKKINKNIAKDLFNSYDGKTNIIINENEDKPGKIIKVEKKIGVNKK